MVLILKLTAESVLDYMTQHKKFIMSEIIDKYFDLQKENRIKDIYLQKKYITKTVLINKFNILSKLIHANNIKNVEIAIRQYLILILINKIDFNEKLLKSYKKSRKFIFYPLPSLWINKLKDDFSLNKFLSLILFKTFILKFFLINILRIIKSLFYLFFYHFESNLAENKYVQFLDLEKNNLPFFNKSFSSKTILNWYIENNNNIRNIHVNVLINEYLYNDVFIQTSIKPELLVKNFSTKLSILFWVLYSSLFSLLNLFIGKWHDSLILYEAYLAKVYDEININLLAKEYLFSISVFSYRPLWTYVIENKGIKISMFSYASSFGGFKYKNNYPDIEYEYQITTWPNIYFFTKEYCDFITNTVQNKINIFCTDQPILFSDKNIEIPYFDKLKSITVFDITPCEYNVICKLLPEFPYRTYENAIQFLEDIYNLCIINDFTLVWKRKRNFSIIHSKKYIKFCIDFEKRKNVIVVDSDIAAYRLIEKSNIVITVPFSTPSLIAKHLKIKSFYYDPTMLLSKDDRAAQGVKFISGYNELKNIKI
jgi:polysaccharide biosynthesis PFTS motif protein